MNRSGFMLVELLIALMISSMLGVILFNAYTQTNRSVRTVDAITNLSGRSVVVRYVMDRDLAGAFIPVEGLKKKKQKEEKTEAQAKQQQTKPAAPAKPTEEKKERKPITKIFYGTNKEGMLDTLTFITNNPMRSQVAVARIVYRLVAEKTADKRKPSYTLLRQEDEKLDFDAFKPDAAKPIQAQELLTGIKKMTATFTAAIVKERTEKKGKEDKKTTETEYKAMSDWNLEDQQPQAEGQPRPQPIPYAVHIELTLWDDRKERERTVSFKTIILPEINEFEPEPKKAKEAEKKPKQQEQGKAAPAGKPGAPGQQQPKKISSLDNSMLMLRRMLMADGGANTHKEQA